MGDVIEHPALRQAEADAAEDREERLFAFAAVRLGLEQEGNLTPEAHVALRRCLVEAGLSETELTAYVHEHRGTVESFLSDTGM